MRKKNPEYYNLYYSQMKSAEARSIDFQLTFNEWLDIWVSSGHLHERGRKYGQYVMCRHGDIGPYSISNVSIKTNIENGREAHKGKPISKDVLIKRGNTTRGSKRSEEAKLNMSIAQTKENRAINAAKGWATRRLNNVNK